MINNTHEALIIKPLIQVIHVQGKNTWEHMNFYLQNIYQAPLNIKAV